MKMSIYFLIILFGMAAAEKPVSRYGEPKPVETYKPQAYLPLVYQKVPVIEPESHGIKEGLKS